MTITKEMGIMEVVSQYPETVEVFVNAGMGCLGCANVLLLTLKTSNKVQALMASISINSSKI